MTFQNIYSPYRPDGQSPRRMDDPLVLGINVPTAQYNHNASAALVKGGRIIALCEQERFDRVKESGRFPRDAVAACLEMGGVALADVDGVALARDPYFVQSRINTPVDANFFVDIARRLGNTFGHLPGLLVCVNHHLCHAASAFYVSGFDESLVISWDGGGDNQHTVAYRGNAKGVTQLEEHPCSFGNLYNKFRRHLNLSDKGSLMGLASYGEKKPGELAGFYDCEQVLIAAALQYARGGEYITDPDLLSRLIPGRLPQDPMQQEHAELAAQVQYAVEELCASVVDKARAVFPSRNLCLAGGVALNATFNGILWRKKLFDDIFIQPNAPDGGLSLGAALEAVRIFSGQTPHCERMEHAYFGPQYRDAEIEHTLQVCRLPSEYVQSETELLKKVAAMLEDGQVVGWFQGRMEWGPRALGNRSILADPRSKATADKVNQIIKYRDEWRPFALSVLAEEADAYMIDPKPDPFMITTAEVRKEQVDRLAGVTHADGTTRPQFVDPRTNPRYHALIKTFAERTGVAGVLNTSFNLKGEPIVCTPRDAVRTFYSSGLEVLVLGNRILRKPLESGESST